MEENDCLELLFCPFPEVQEKYKEPLDNKAKFLIKIMMLRYQGKMLTLACKIDSWIEDNYEKLYEDPSVRQNLLKLNIGNKKRMERYRANLSVAEKYSGYQK